MSIRNAIITILGNKSDCESMFESDILTMEHTVKRLHESFRIECMTKTCRHLIFGRCSTLTGLNLDGIFTELGTGMLTIAVKDLQVEQLRQDVNIVNKGYKNS
jgi:hypothetical protein